MHSEKKKKKKKSLLVIRSSHTAQLQLLTAGMCVPRPLRQNIARHENESGQFCSNAANGGVQ